MIIAAECHGQEVAGPPWTVNLSQAIRRAEIGSWWGDEADGAAASVHKAQLTHAEFLSCTDCQVVFGMWAVEKQIFAQTEQFPCSVLVVLNLSGFGLPNVLNMCLDFFI